MGRSASRGYSRSRTRLYAQYQLRFEFGLIWHRFESWPFLSQEPLSRSKHVHKLEGGTMKHLPLLTLCLAVALYCGPAFAQHGHMGGGSTHGAASHDNTNDVNTGSGSSHRVTIDQQLSNHTKLAGKIQNLTGLPAQQACDGFKNLGQCVAAAHVSKNLGISFVCMRSDMTGQAPPSGSNCP